MVTVVLIGILTTSVCTPLLGTPPTPPWWLLVLPPVSSGSSPLLIYYIPLPIYLLYPYLLLTLVYYLTMGYCIYTMSLLGILSFHYISHRPILVIRPTFADTTVVLSPGCPPYFTYILGVVLLGILAGFSG